ncbi:MAG: hypothetical protein NTV25_04925 [Methanothrix sp.]|nr:hypothetical protein [Methanothrix sp.]
MTGCIEKAPQLSQAPSPMAEHQLAEELPSSLQVDFDAEVSSSLFRVRGNIMVPGNGSIPYLLLNATLRQGGLALQSTKYMLMDVEPGEDHGFEISKNMKISPGSYNCTLVVAGPKDSLACETRRCKASIPWTEPSPVVNLLPEAASKKAEQKVQEEMIRDAGDRKEKIQEEEAKEVAEESRALSKASSEEAAPRKEDSQAENASQENDSSFQAGASLKASSALSSGQEGMFAGSSTSKKYHRLDCRYAAKIKPENKIYFSGEEDARQQGYLPCKTCNP